MYQKKLRCIILYAFLSVAISVVIVGLCFFFSSKRNDNATQNQIEVKSFEEVSSKDFEFCVKPANFNTETSANDLEESPLIVEDDSYGFGVFMTQVAVKVLVHIATGENRFTISSEDDLEYYMEASHYELKDVNFTRVIDGGFGYNIQMKITTNYPVDFYPYLTIPPGFYPVEPEIVDGEFTGNFLGYQVYSQIEGYYQIELMQTNNISLTSDMSFRSGFAGIYNGNGKKITLSNEHKLALEDAVFCDGTTEYGKIKNTHFYCDSSFNGYCDAFAGNSTFAGIIAGYNEGTIENCIVENAKFTSNRYKSNCNVAPLVGKNNGIVLDCLVAGKYTVVSRSWNLMSNPDGAMIYAFVASGNDVRRCVNTCTALNVNYLEEGDDKSCLVEDFTKYHTSSYVEKKSSYRDLGSGINLGGPTGSTAWYFKTGWDYPYLRSFLSWTAFWFDKNGDDDYETKKYVWANDAETVAAGIANSTNKSATIGSEVVTASTPAAGYEFVKWTRSGFYFSATYTKKVFILSFKKPQLDGKEQDIAPSVYLVNVHYGDRISVSLSHSATATVLTYEINDVTITYVIARKFTVSKFGSVGDLPIINGTKVPDLQSKETYNIIPILELKTYNIVFP